jgi:hypothetical protein
MQTVLPLSETMKNGHAFIIAGAILVLSVNIEVRLIGTCILVIGCLIS